MFLLKNRSFEQEKKKKSGQGRTLCRNIVSECRDIISREPATLCRKKVHAELKGEIELCVNKEFFCHDTVEEVCEKDCHDTLDSITTLIKENGSRTLLRQSLLCRNIQQ